MASRALELGAGAGTASLCLAARIPAITVTGIEIDPDLVQLANDNAAANGMQAGCVSPPPISSRCRWNSSANMTAC